MRVARFFMSGRPTVVVADNGGAVDYGALLESRGLKSEFAEAEQNQRLIRMIRRGLLESGFIREQLDWSRRSGRTFAINVDGLIPMLPFRPCKIICVARNWESHALESDHDLPDRPVFFAKTSNCAIGPGEAIEVPSDVGRVDHEGELAVVIGRRAKRVASNDAGRYIHSYTVINDVTARGLQHELGGAELPWYAAKSMDTFAPLGPWLVLKDDAEPLSGKRIRVTVNDQTRQDGGIDDMHWDVPQLIEAISRNITLEPGDVIACGTPPGVGPLAAGDTVTVMIDGIGELTNPVRSV